MQQYIKNINDWILVNEVSINTILDFLSLVITAVLTGIIIWQTSKLAKQQSVQEEEISQQQAELQKRQIKLDTFEYKNRIYHALYKVFQLTGEVQSIYKKINLKDKSMDQLYQIFDSYLKTIKIDVPETLWVFKQAEYILPDNIYSSVYDIAGNLNELTGNIGKFNLYPKILAEHEIEEYKKELLEDIQIRSNQINKHVLFINSIMKKELSISNLEK